MAMTNEQLTKWIDEIFGTIDEIKQNSGDISGLTRSVRQLREDLTATQADVTDLEDQTAGTVSMAKAQLQHFTDGSATQALDLVADIIPVQAGTGDPSPTNVRAISGYSSVTASTGGGENLIDITDLVVNKSEVGVTFTVNPDGTITGNGTATGPTSISFVVPAAMAAGFKNKFFISGVDFPGMFVALEKTTSPYTKYAIDNGKGSLISDSIGEAEVNLICRFAAGTVFDNTIISPRILKANTATLSLGRTIYGGSADFTTGAETETLVAEDIGTSENITWEDAPALQAQGVFPFTISGADYVTQSWMAEKYKIVYGNDWTVENGQIKVTVTAGGSVGCRLCDTNYTSLEALKTALTGSKLIHPITTPNTYTTTPAQLELLQGENNVSATSGPITLTYAPDNVLAEVYAYIQKRFDTLTASLAVNRTTRKTTKTLTKKED